MSASLTIATALQWGRAELGSHSGRDVEYLLRAATRLDRASLLICAEQRVNQEEEIVFREYVSRRLTGEPVQYIVGRQEFWGLEMLVTPAVLIPRPETEHLVEEVLARTDRSRALRIADVGTGSGAIAIALASELPLAQLLAIDISQTALEVARHNARVHGVAERIEFSCADLLHNISLESLDLVASNPPYVAESDRVLLPDEVVRFEPEAALFAPDDGYFIYERLIPQAFKALKPGGWLVLEIGAGQGDRISSMLTGWRNLTRTRDLAGIERVFCAQRS